MVPAKESLVYLIFLAVYGLISLPFIIGYSLGDSSGEIIGIKTVSGQDLPPEILSALPHGMDTDSDTYTVLTVNNNIPFRRWVIILYEDGYSRFKTGEIVEIREKTLDWYISWQKYPFMEKYVNHLYVGEVSQIQKTPERITMTLLQKGRLGKFVFVLSTGIMLVGAFLIIPLISLVYRKNAVIWKFCAPVSFYSLSLLLMSYIKLTHSYQASINPSILIYLLITSVFLIVLTGGLTILSWQYEGGSAGQRFRKKISTYLVRGLKDIFS